MQRFNVAMALTVGRLVLAPVFVLIYACIDIWPGILSQLTALSLIWATFIVMELTDVLDGMVARRQGLVSDLGKILDPFADVVCRLTYFIILTVAEVMPLWFVIVVLYRELGIILLRMVLYRGGYALGAGSAGKLKSWFYGVSAAAGLFLVTIDRLDNVPAILSDNLTAIRAASVAIYAVSAILALGSFAGYLRVFLSRTRAGTQK